MQSTKVAEACACMRPGILQRNLELSLPESYTCELLQLPGNRLTCCSYLFKVPCGICSWKTSEVI